MSASLIQYLITVSSHGRSTSYTIHRFRCSVTCVAGQSSIGTNSGLPLRTQNFMGLRDWRVPHNYSTSTTASFRNSLTSLHQADQSPFDDKGLRSGAELRSTASIITNAGALIKKTKLPSDKFARERLRHRAYREKEEAY